MMKMKSKKGFTLVELVTVIAILAVLAAIAIPAVLVAIKNADESAGQTNAESLETACKIFYTGVISGQINKSNFDPADGSDMTIHYPGSSKTVRERDADSATVADVIKYSGLSESIVNDLRYDTSNRIGGYYTCTIIYQPQDTPGTTKLTLETKISALNVDGSVAADP